jgi:hypothetical protein
MKTRIKEITNSNGEPKFVPQYRLFGFVWTSWGGSSYYPRVEFCSLEKSREWLNFKEEAGVKYHEA